MACTLCRLHETRKKIVKAFGHFPADVLFVGEAPGKSEDAAGKPFIGPSGRILRQALDIVGERHNRARGLRICITNICRCRPCDEREGPNREPKPDEAAACLPYLHRTQRKADPRIIIALGKTAEKYLRPFYPELRALPHPAYVLRCGGLRSPQGLQFVRLLEEALLQCHVTK